DALESIELRGIAEDLLRELAPVDLLVLAEDLRAEGLHDRAVADGPARLLVVNDGVGVEHLRAQLAQHRRDGRLPRPDRPGETDDSNAHASSPGGAGSFTFARSS